MPTEGQTGAATGAADLLRIVGLWRGRWPYLLAGVVITALSVASQVGLSAAASRTVLGIAAGGVLMAVLGPTRVILRYAERMVSHDALFRALSDVRVWFFRRLAARSAGGLGFARGGDLLARLVGDVAALDGLYIRVALPVVSAALLLPAVMVLGRHLGVVADLGLAALFAAAALLLPWATARVVAARSQAVAQARAGLRVAVIDALSGMREVRAFGAETRVLDAVGEQQRIQVAAETRMAAAVARVAALGMLAGQGVLLIALASAHRAGAAGAVAFFVLVPAVELTGLLSGSGVAAGQARAAAARVLAVADAPPPVPDPVVPRPMPSGHAIRLEGIDFAWAPDRPQVFCGLSLDIPQGARVALLGPSGAGKSSLAALLLKVAAPNAGRVLLGGVDIAALPAAAVRARIGWLSQATHLFDDTIAANLRLAVPDAPDSALWEALDAARLGDWVRGLPDGLATWVGEGGANLSGGQGRRLALARTLLTQAPILLLDEPAEGLDAETERAFLTTLNEVAVGRTVVLIVHRLVGVERLDRIWRLSRGHAVAAAG